MYDRQLLLLGAKRNAVLDLHEIESYGRDSYGDPDHVCIYGLRPAEWHARGIRLLGRTAVECTRDEFADRIGRDVAAVAAARGERGTGPLLIDPFAGSGNTLYWLATHLAVQRGFGFELDPGVFALTRQNLAALTLPIDVLNVDFEQGLERVEAGAGQLVVAFVAPPWGDALDPVEGLDLRGTYPPVTDVVARLGRHFAHSPMLFAVQVHERIAADSLRELSARFEWSSTRIYDLLAPGQNQGILLGTIGWRPPEAAPVGAPA